MGTGWEKEIEQQLPAVAVVMLLLIFLGVHAVNLTLDHQSISGGAFSLGLS